MTLLLLVTLALGGNSVDTVISKPILSPNGTWTIESAELSDPGILMPGLGYQIEQRPLDIYSNGEYLFPAVDYRQAIYISSTYTFNKRFEIRANQGVYYQTSEADTIFAPEKTLGFGDTQLMFKALLAHHNSFLLSMAFDLQAPTGSKNSWISETVPRYGLSVLATNRVNNSLIYSKLGIETRKTEDFDLDFEIGPELLLGVGSTIPLTRLFSIVGEVTSRHGFENFMQSGAENPVEGKIGLELNVPQKVKIGAALGSGFNHGYGSSQIKGLISFVIIPQKTKEKYVPEQTVTIQKIPEIPTKKEIFWNEGVKAKVYHGTIIIKEPIKFEFNSTNILQESLPTIQAVADVMNHFPQIEHLVIQGHTSAEEPEHALAINRAETIFKRLVLSNVRPQRVSFSVSSGEESLVTFKIAKMLPYGVATDGGEPIICPWDGIIIDAPQIGDGKLSGNAHPILEDQTEDALNPDQFMKDFFEEDDEGIDYVAPEDE